MQVKIYSQKDIEEIMHNKLSRRLQVIEKTIDIISLKIVDIEQLINKISLHNNLYKG